MKNRSFTLLLKKPADKNCEPISGNQIRGGEASANQKQACKNNIWTQAIISQVDLCVFLKDHLHFFQDVCCWSFVTQPINDASRVIKYG